MERMLFFACYVLIFLMGFGIVGHAAAGVVGLCYGLLVGAIAGALTAYLVLYREPPKGYQ